MFSDIVAARWPAKEAPLPSSCSFLKVCHGSQQKASNACTAILAVTRQLVDQAAIQKLASYQR